MKSYISSKDPLKAAFAGMSILLFSALKIFHLTLRFGDGNAYIYMAKMLSEGVMPYRDFFLADPPFLILLLTAIRFIFKNNLLLYQLIPILFEIGTAILLYLLLKKWKSPFYYLAPLFYLFSFTILSTSDYITGVQVVVFFMTAGIYLYETEKPFFSGLAWCLAVLTKMYAAPALLGFLIYIVLQKDWKSLKMIILAGAVGTLVIFGPFLFLSFDKVRDYLLIHQLNRPQGIQKMDVIFFFLRHEWFFILGAILAMKPFWKKTIIFPFLWLISFFLIFPDIYYTYLATVMPFLVSLKILTLGQFQKKHIDVVVAVLTAYFFFFSYSVFTYIYSYKPVGRFTNYEKISEYVKTLPADMPIYGSHEVAPVIALQTDRKLFQNYIDTNPQAFASNAQSLRKVSQEGITTGIYLVGRMNDYPQWNIKNKGTEGFFSEDLFDTYCREIKKFPSTSREADNYIKIFRCKK